MSLHADRTCTSGEAAAQRPWRRVADSSQDAATGCEEGITAQQTSTYAGKDLAAFKPTLLEHLFIRTIGVASMLRKPLGPPQQKGAPVLEQPWPEALVPKQVGGDQRLLRGRARRGMQASGRPPEWRRWHCRKGAGCQADDEGPG